MKFSIKSAGRYSNALSNLISEFSTFYGRDEFAGLVKVTEIHQKSKIKTGELNTVYEDETKEVKPSSAMAQIDPNIRLKIIEDLVEEKNKIDAKINNEKSKLSLVSPITGETINIDFAKKENSFYNKNLVTVYSSCSNITEGEEEKEGYVQTIVDGKSVQLAYPILIEKEALMDVGEIVQKSQEISEKLQQESDEIDRLQGGTVFEFDNKFSTFDTKESLIKKYTK